MRITLFLSIMISSFLVRSQDTLSLAFPNAMVNLNQHLVSKGDLINDKNEGYWMGDGYIKSANGSLLIINARIRLKRKTDLGSIRKTDWTRFNLFVLKEGNDFYLQIEDVNMDKFPGDFEQHIKGKLNADLRNDPLDLGLFDGLDISKIHFSPIDRNSFNLLIITGS